MAEGDSETNPASFPVTGGGGFNVFETAMVAAMWQGPAGGSAWFLAVFQVSLITQCELRSVPTQANIPDTAQFRGHRHHCGCCNCRAHKEPAEGRVPSHHFLGASLCGSQEHSPTGRQKGQERGHWLKAGQR